MSDAARNRISMIQHKRRQREAHGVLSAISDKLGEARLALVEPELSFSLQGEMYEKLKAMRDSEALCSATFTTAEAAIDELLAHASSLGADLMCEVYTGARGSGFFTGPFSRAFLMSCLEEGHEGIALVQPSLVSGVLLDVALDDPTRGDFYEVEWW